MLSAKKIPYILEDDDLTLEVTYEQIYKNSKNRKRYRI